MLPERSLLKNHMIFINICGLRSGVRENRTPGIEGDNPHVGTTRTHPSSPPCKPQINELKRKAPLFWGAWIEWSRTFMRIVTCCQISNKYVHGQ